ncbi:MAG TPA: hypothetical protein VFX97_06990 [Pyrinomonadaceae bacterium]|nr:hypothetical protein [Pyrinomonadaceae bacterium]
MRHTALLIGALLFLSEPGVYAQQQSNEPPKVEVGVHFTSITGQEIQPFFFPHSIKSESGLGARFSYNLTKHVALEAEGNLLARGGFAFGFDSAAYNVQGQFGVKAGKRFERFGVFAKARPGLLSVPEILVQTGTQTIETGFPFPPFTYPVFEARRKNFFTLDVGGVLEFYPSRRMLVRFDAGNTVVHVGDVRSVSFTDIPPPPMARTTHNFQFSAGVAFRFRDPEPPSADANLGRSDVEQKFEAGVQFTSLLLRVWADTQLPALGFDGRDAQSGFGGRLTYNFTRNIAAEVQTDFFPKDLSPFPFSNFANGRAGGRMIQAQAGPKIGKRFEKFGVFGKVRPGAVSFSETTKWNFVPSPHNPTPQIQRRTFFSLDVGGVLEFYPTPRIVTRFDGGDTIIFYGSTQVPFLTLRTPIFEMPARRKHQFQFSAGVGFRF